MLGIVYGLVLLALVLLVVAWFLYSHQPEDHYRIVPRGARLAVAFLWAISACLVLAFALWVMTQDFL
jgi:hypothetical protein